MAQNCLYCNQNIFGKSILVKDGYVHTFCYKFYILEKEGLVNPCYNCNQTGFVTDNIKKKALSCDWDRCVGCDMCADESRQIVCNCCYGIGFHK